VGIGLFEMSYDRWASFVTFSFVVKNTPGAAIRSAQYTLQFMWARDPLGNIQSDLLLSDSRPGIMFYHSALQWIVQCP
jgi:hypothetical protein